MRTFVSLALAATFAMPTAAVATTLCVAPGGAGGCLPTLQEAIDAAENKDVIQIAPGTYPGGNDVSMNKLTIEGSGVGSTVIDATGSFWGLRVLSRSNISISGVTIQNADATGMLLSGKSKLVVTASEIRGNGGDGVRPFDDGDKLTLIDSSISGNADVGVEVICRCKVTVLRSTLSENLVGITARAGAKVSVFDSTISGNHWTFGGAAIAVGESSGTATPATRGVVKVRGSTITDHVGPAVRVGTRSKVTLQSTIVADSGAEPCATVGTKPKLTSKGFNLVDQPGCGSPKPTDIVGVDPLLGPLQDNGGPTETHALGATSPAKDVVTRASLCKVDQRGAPRAAPCDVGAFEAS